MLKFSNFKMVTAGDYVHLYEYQKANSYGYKKPKKPKRETNRETEPTDSQPENNHIYRTRKQVRFLLQSNIGINTPINRLQFVTYTFRKEITEFKQANNLFNTFTKRLNYYLQSEKLTTENLKYFLVPEIQHSRAKKYGAKVWHFHVIYFNLPAVYYPKLFKIWGNGGIKVKQMNNLDHLVNYVTKYFTKSKSEDYAKGQHKFFTSRGLQRPWEFREADIITEFQKNLDGVGKPTFIKTYKSHTWDGQENETTYSIYKLTSDQKALLQQLKSVL